MLDASSAHSAQVLHSSDSNGSSSTHGGRRNGAVSRSRRRTETTEVDGSERERRQRQATEPVSVGITCTLVDRSRPLDRRVRHARRVCTDRLAGGSSDRWTVKTAGQIRAEEEVVATTYLASGAFKALRAAPNGATSLAERRTCDQLLL